MSLMLNAVDETPSDDTSILKSSINSLLPPSKCQAYISIFEDAIDQLAVLGEIAPEIYKGNDKPLADSITKILKDQRALEEKHQLLIQEQDVLKDMQNKSQFRQGQLAILDVMNELQQLTQVLAKRLKAHPSVAQNLLKIQQERSLLQTLISKTIRELKEYRYESLICAVEEEYKKKNTLQNTINRENEASEMLKELQRDLFHEKKLLEDESNDRNQVIQQLKDTIQEINALTSSEQKYVRKEIKAHENSTRQQFQAKESALLEMRALKEKQIEVENRAHEKIIDFLSRQRDSLEVSIQQWMTKYEEDTEAKSNELENLKVSRTSDLDKFEELMQEYEELSLVVEEDKQNKKRLEEEEKRQNLLMVEKESSKKGGSDGCLQKEGKKGKRKEKIEMSVKVKEGSGEIALDEKVFYNPIQEFNRDLSVAVIQNWFKISILEKSEKSGNKITSLVDERSSIPQGKVETDKDDVETQVTGKKPNSRLDMRKKLQMDYQGKNALASDIDINDAQYAQNSYSILEALSASGLRSIRYAKELPHVSKIIANDLDISAFEAISKNIESNNVKDVVQPNHANANQVLYEAIISGKKFDVIDLDPYGSAAPFLDASVQAVAEGGILCITCTDMAVLAGSQSETCWSKYGGMNIPNAPYTHELALRILLQCIQSCATRNKRYIEPLLSCSIDFYARVFVRVKSQASEVKKAASLSSVVYHCYNCKHFQTQPIGKRTETKVAKGVSVKFGPGKGPAVSPFCEYCQGVYHMGGPFYSGPMHNKKFVDSLLYNLSKSSKESFGTFDRMFGMVSLISEELDLPFYHSIPHVCNVLHASTPPLDVICSALLNGGYKVSETHAAQTCIKTDAPLKAIWDIIIAYCKQNTPILESKLTKESPAYKILKLDATFKVDFTNHPNSKGNTKKFKMVRHQENPTSFWGPKSRPKKRKIEEENSKA